MLVSGLAGTALVLPDRGVQDRDGLGERDGDIGVDGGLAGGLGGLAFELDEPFGGGVRFGGCQPGQVVLPGVENSDEGGAGDCDVGAR
jgi:hypothetical protein